MSDYVLIHEQLARIFPPIPADHPLLEHKCAGCKESFQEGDVTLLVQIGPADDPQERAKARAGQGYNAVSVPAHLACVTGEER